MIQAADGMPLSIKNAIINDVKEIITPVSGKADGGPCAQAACIGNQSAVFIQHLFIDSDIIGQNRMNLLINQVVRFAVDKGGKPVKLSGIADLIDILFIQFSRFIGITYHTEAVVIKVMCGALCQKQISIIAVTKCFIAAFPIAGIYRPAIKHGMRILADGLVPDLRAVRHAVLKSVGDFTGSEGITGNILYRIVFRDFCTRLLNCVAALDRSRSRRTDRIGRIHTAVGRDRTGIPAGDEGSSVITNAADAARNAILLCCRCTCRIPAIGNRAACCIAANTADKIRSDKTRIGQSDTADLRIFNITEQCSIGLRSIMQIQTADDMPLAVKFARICIRYHITGAVLYKQHADRCPCPQRFLPCRRIIAVRIKCSGVNGDIRSQNGIGAGIRVIYMLHEPVELSAVCDLINIVGIEYGGLVACITLRAEAIRIRCKCMDTFCIQLCVAVGRLLITAGCIAAEHGISFKHRYCIIADGLVPDLRAVRHAAVQKPGDFTGSELFRTAVLSCAFFIRRIDAARRQCIFLIIIAVLNSSLIEAANGTEFTLCQNIHIGKAI